MRAEVARSEKSAAARAERIAAAEKARAARPEHERRKDAIEKVAAEFANRHGCDRRAALEQVRRAAEIGDARRKGRK